jgi:hypothetical protein
MGFRRSVAAAGTLAMLVVLAGAGPGHATVFERGEFSFQESAEEDLCGIAVRVDTVGTVKFRSRTGKHDLDQAFFGHSNFEYTDTFTNLATGAFFTISGHEAFRDITATRVSGNVFEFTLKQSGAPATVRDMDGNVVIRDRGTVTFTQLFDTLGDSQPGGEVLEETVDRLSGPHPLADMSDEEFCEMALDLIG